MCRRTADASTCVHHHHWGCSHDVKQETKSLQKICEQRSKQWQRMVELREIYDPDTPPEIDWCLEHFTKNRVTTIKPPKPRTQQNHKLLWDRSADKNLQSDGSVSSDDLKTGVRSLEGGGTAESNQHTDARRTRNLTGTWPPPPSPHSHLFLGDLPSAAVSSEGSCVFLQWPSFPTGIIKTGGTSTPTLTSFPPPLPHLTLLQTLPEVFLPGDPGLSLHLICGGSIFYRVDRNCFNFQGSNPIRIYKNKPKAWILTWARELWRSPTGKNWTDDAGTICSMGTEIKILFSYSDLLWRCDSSDFNINSLKSNLFWTNLFTRSYYPYFY